MSVAEAAKRGRGWDQDGEAVRRISEEGQWAEGWISEMPVREPVRKRGPASGASKRRTCVQIKQTQH